MRDSGLRILVLGSAAGGGFPQWNCRCPVCTLAWNGDPRVEARSQSSVAVSADGERWLLLNASPDIREQIARAAVLQPRGTGRQSPIAAVFLTNGDVDHVAGLLSLRERQGFDLFATAQTLGELAANPIFGVLDPGYVARRVVQLDERIETKAGVSVTAFAVPGKAPLFREGEHVEIGVETGETIGLEITLGSARVVFIPACAAVTPALRRRVTGASLLLFDGTLSRDDEMIRLGLSDKTSRRMGHMPIFGDDGTLAALDGIDVQRKVFIHINNSNPVLVAGAPERLAVEAAGWQIARDGESIWIPEART